MASTSSTGAAAASSPIDPALIRGDVQQPEVMSSGISDSHGVTRMPAPMNPLLLASACFGSSGALNFLFSREDTQKPPMIMPTQKFLDLLTPVSSTRRRLTMPKQASGDVEDGVDLASGDDNTTTLLLQGVTPQGDNALHVVASHWDNAPHVVASHGDDAEFVNCATIIDKRDQDLLFAVNRKGDTPLHCAARAGKSQVLSYLIELAKSSNRLHELLRKENALKETALHDAIRIGKNDIVGSLLEADPELVNYPKPKLANYLKEGTSPLYLAISLKRDIIARTLHEKSNGNLSYHGSCGQKALHAAVLQGTAMTKRVLTWNNSLTTHGDRDGSTPLHLASSLRCSNRFKKILKANPASVFQADNNGFFPIHVAASVGAKDTISIILEKFPSSAGLRTAHGRTFLHVAVEKRRLNIVSFVCRTSLLDWILNMRDNDGNTALHLAVQAGKLRMFCSLYGNKEVQLILRNNHGQTPLDLSKSLLPTGMHYTQNTEQRIYNALALVEGKHSFIFWDQINEMYTQPINSEGVINEEGKVKDASQMLGLGSVLIATVAFGATFALPGGYRADDHINGGTPTLVGRYTFDAFMMANALAFICSSIATIGLMFSGSSMVKLMSRQINLRISVFFVSSSLTSLVAAFALGVYMVLAPVAHDTAIAVCAVCPVAVLYRNFEFLVKLSILAQPLCNRMGLIRALRKLARRIFFRMLRELWPFILIFGWATVAQKLRNH